MVTREYTVHLHKYVHGRSFKKRAPTAVKSVVAFAQREMGTSDVRIDPKLNQALWARGIKSVPHRIRVKLERESLFSRTRLPSSLPKPCPIPLTPRYTGKRNDEENAKEKLYTYASHVPTASFKVGLLASLFFGIPLVIQRFAESWDSERRRGVNARWLVIPSCCPLCTTYVCLSSKKSCIPSHSRLPALFRTKPAHQESTAYVSDLPLVLYGCNLVNRSIAELRSDLP